VPYGPVNRESAQFLDEDRLSEIPTSPANLPRQFIQNWAWWADNGVAITERFEDWLLTEPEGTPDPNS
jgi:putative spermidine/putrescine transport system substrate-binding protein